MNRVEYMVAQVVRFIHTVHEKNQMKEHYIKTWVLTLVHTTNTKGLKSHKTSAPFFFSSSCYIVLNHS